ncbi:protein lin-28 homolog A [Athene cunicularia]|uniref:protein lin-28 homolog A n=1 Tax=Athene cunicularia TaxID=194338 RepID=UPI000EF64941|nr:protein lin-28 homolog A [Athene cunicularia]
MARDKRLRQQQLASTGLELRPDVLVLCVTCTAPANQPRDGAGIPAAASSIHLWIIRGDGIPSSVRWLVQDMSLRVVSKHLKAPGHEAHFTGAKPGEEPAGDSPKAENEPQPLHGSGICKWFNVRMGFGFLSMTAKGGATLDSPVDVFVHQSKLHMEGFRSLKEGEAVEFTFKKSSKGLESIRVTGPGGVFCIGSERRPKGKSLQKRRSKGDRRLDHHAKECKLPPQPKKCHFCQSISHMVANCPAKAQQSPSSQGKPAYFREEEDMHSSALLPETRE